MSLSEAVPWGFEAVSPAQDLPGCGRLLVIGYGNELRGDDAAGPIVARRIASHQFGGVRSVAAPVLLPEMAAEMAQSRSVLFVDASLRCASAGVRLHRVGAKRPSGIWSGSYTPEALCALCQSAYELRPESWLMEIPAVRFGFGHGLSPIATQGIKTATRLVRLWIDRQAPLTPKTDAGVAPRSVCHRR